MRSTPGVKNSLNVNWTNLICFRECFENSVRNIRIYGLTLTLVTKLNALFSKVELVLGANNFK
jgi:hypothetical protein